MPLSPLIWPSSGWYGSDGNWSTFVLSVGTPPQVFPVLPSTTTSEVWLPLLEGCSSYPQLNNCTVSRGAIAAFQPNASATWHQLGLYSLASEQALYPEENGLFGLDDIKVSTATISNQTVAGIASRYFWLVSFGLGNGVDMFQSMNDVLQSPLHCLNDTIPSVSFGYYAGAKYRDSPGTLILGGYDAAAIQTSLTVKTSGAGLLINLAGVVATNSLLGTASLVPSSNGLTMKIDSTVSQMWLPPSACNVFEQAFGLLYDSSTNLYLVNSTMRERLQQLAPQLTFTLATGPSSGETTNIVFPYAAFDLSIGMPIYNSSYYYFPLARAANDSQYILGRAFLQEAYLVVDWERGNFSIGQAQHNSKSNVVTIESSKQTSSSGQSLPIAVIVGASVGGLLAILLTACFFWWRSKPRSAEASPSRMGHPPHYGECKKDIVSPMLSELEQIEPKSAEAMSEPVHELGDMQYQLMSTELCELPGDSKVQELCAVDGKVTVQKVDV